MRKTDPSRDLLIVLGMAATVIVPAVLTHLTVHSLPGEVAPSDNPTPLGYTVSLLLFVVPVLTVGYWHMRFPRHPVDRKALLLSAAAMAGVGVILDLVFGYTFFEFPNPGATLGVRLPALSFCLPGTDPCAVGLVPRHLPLEEFAFYIFGAVYMVSVYLWADTEWLQDYDPEDHKAAAQNVSRMLQPSLPSLVLWGLLVAMGFAVKRNLDPDFPHLIPGYYLFLMVLGFLPTFILYRAVKQFMNWRAFAFAFSGLVLISVIWEATLGVPYGWWMYKREYMLGLKFHAWSDLPVEAVMLWLVGSWDAIMLYEFLRAYLHMDRSPKERLFGRAPGGGEKT
jgi:hypothetical protein